MGNDGPQHSAERAGSDPSRASTAFIRWWHADRSDPQSCRGTLRSLDGEPLGSFDGMDGLFALLLANSIGPRPGPG